VDNIELWFVQIGSHQKTPNEVQDLIGEYPTTVWLDDEEETIWTAFASTWYEAVLLDPEGCIVAKFGPFTQDPVDPAKIIPLWKGAALGTLPCDEPDPGPETGPEPNLRPEPDLDVLEAVDQVEPEADGFAPEIIETADVIEDLPADLLTDVPVDVPADVPPDVPPDLPGDIPEVPPGWCQVQTPATPPTPGDALPPFTCVDLNPASATVGEVVSKSSLKQKVWLAYAGSGG
jgi:hypothetical protein